MVHRLDIARSALASVLMVATAAKAESSDEAPRPVGFVLALSSGYSFPIGSPDSGAPDAVTGILKGFVPVDLEGGVQLGPHWRILAYGGVGLLVRNTPSCRTVECGDSFLQAGGKIAFIGRGPGGWDLIAAVGAGWHRLKLSVKTPDSSTEATATGVEGIFEVAALYPVAPAFALGPFLGASVVSASGWTNVIDGQTTQTSGNHVDGAFSFGLRMELRL